MERGLEVVAADYGAGTVQRLRGALPGAEVVQHDLLADAPLPADVHLFHRIDTEFTDRQWRQLFTRFQNQVVLLVASEVLSGRDLPHKLRLAWRNRAGSRAGWLRNRASYESLWARTHWARPVRLGDLGGWLLR